MKLFQSFEALRKTWIKDLFWGSLEKLKEFVNLFNN
jgi:hypothetical protein